MERWSLPHDLAGKVLDRLDLAPPEGPDGVAALVEHLGRRIPRGSTAKLRDLAARRRPAGDDPAEVAEGWLTDPRTAWTCWAASTLTAALVHTGPLQAQVIGVRRVGDDAPPVDVHSAVMIADRGRRWVCDPHFGIGPVPVTGGGQTRPALVGTLQARPEGRFDWTIGGPPFSPAALHYRSLTGPLERGDVAMFCEVSVTYSGVKRKPFAFLLLPDGSGTLRAEEPDAPPELRLWRDAAAEPGSDAQPEIFHPDSWNDGMDMLLTAGAGRLSYPLGQAGPVHRR
jgi:hypothetical protein